MNLAATPPPSDANLLLAAFAATTPAANAQADPSSSPFVSLIQLLTQSSNGAQLPLASDAGFATDFSTGTPDASSSISASSWKTTGPASTYTAQAPDAIADSVIRAMLGGPAATPSLAAATGSIETQPASAQSFSQADPSSSGGGTSHTPFTNSYSGDSPSRNDDASVLAQVPLAAANPLLDSSSKNFVVPTSPASATEFNPSQNTPIRNASEPDPQPSAASTPADSADAIDISQGDVPAVTIAATPPADPALPPNAIPSRKRKTSDATQAASLLTFAAPVATASSADGVASKASAASSSVAAANAAASSATTSSTTPASAPTTRPNNSQSLTSPVASNSLPGPAQSPNSSRTATVAFGANIAEKVAAQNATADRTAAVAPNTRSLQQDFRGDQAQTDSNGLSAPKASERQDSASTGDSSQADVSDTASNSTQQSSQQQTNTTPAGPAPVSLTAATVAPIAIAPGVPSHTVATNTSNTAASVSAAMSETSPAPAAPSATPQQMTLRVSPPSGDAGTIDVRVAQRAGQMQVTVHTADPTLQANLRQDLPELVQSLDRAGFNAETFVQRGAATAAGGPSLDPSFSQGSSFGQNSFGQSSFNQGSNSGSSDPRAFGGGSGSGNSQESPFAGQHFSGQQSSGQNARDREAERWLEQIEE